MPVFVDTNVLVYARDPRDPGKQQQARAWLEHLWESSTGRLSFQVLEEFYITMTRKLRPAAEPGAVRDEVRRYLCWDPQPVGGDTLETAWALQDRYQLSFWDGLVVASAHKVGCQHLLTEDLQAGQDFGGVVVVNPFGTAPGNLAD